MDRLRGCVAAGSYGPNMTVFPSKADRIMSRYRPIAPKPSLPCTSEADRSASSALTIDNPCCRQVPNAPTALTDSTVKQQKNKRVRKRPCREIDSQARPAKKQAMGCISDQAGHGEKALAFGLMVDGPQMTQDDAGFMERAAASAPSSVFPTERTWKPTITPSHGFGGCFTEMIRGIAGRPLSTHAPNIPQHHPQQESPQQPPASLPQQQIFPCFASRLKQWPSQQPAKQAIKDGILENCRDSAQQPGKQVMKDGVQENCRDFAMEERSSDAFWSLFGDTKMPADIDRGTSEEWQHSGLEEEGIEGRNEERKNIVTLSLLPEVPMRTDSPTVSTCSSAPSISMSGSEHVTMSGQNTMDYVELVYGKSPEPVVLIDDSSQKILWVNQSYTKACKGSLNTPVPFIDPLGIPTRVGQFQLQASGQTGFNSATLWGFLKKLVFDAPNQDATRYIPCFVGIPYQSACGDLCLSHQPSLHIKKDGQNDPRSSNSRVITPQPLRLVGSVVSLDSVTEVHDGEAMTGDVELLQKRLEEGSLPAFMTDLSNVVRWVNSAYRAMVGQPECPWLVSTMKSGASSPTITGEVSLSYNVDVPSAASSFSGRANIQWTRNTAERNCMMVPCDVSSLMEKSGRKSLVWMFDIQASLSLMCGSKS